jgi:hypothetical protein
MRTRLLVTLLATVLIVALCACGGTTPTSPATPAAPAASQTSSADREPEPLVAKGHVTDAAGRPLAGAVINADWQLSDDYSLDGTTDANGDYRIALDPPESSWHMNGTYSTSWHGTDYTFELDPVDDSNFVGAAGGVRDFVWRLSGELAEGGAYYGGSVDAYMDFSGGIPIDPQYVHLTLTPDGPLVDGSTGSVITAVGDSVHDVPVGRYVVSATYEEPGAASVDLLVRVRNTGDYADNVEAQFEQVSATGQGLELEVRSP